MWCVVSFYFFFFFLRCMTDMDSDLPADCVRTGGGRRCQETETGLQAGTGGRLHEPGELRTSFPRAHWDRRQKTRVEKKKKPSRAWAPVHLLFSRKLHINQATKNPHHINALLPRWIENGPRSWRLLRYPWCNRVGGRVWVSGCAACEKKTLSPSPGKMFFFK